MHASGPFLEIDVVVATKTDLCSNSSTLLEYPVSRIDSIAIPTNNKAMADFLKNIMGASKSSASPVPSADSGKLPAACLKDALVATAVANA